MIRPRPTIGLGSFLVLVTLSGPLIWLIHSIVAQPRMGGSSFPVTLANATWPPFEAHVICRYPLLSGSPPQCVFVIVRPGEMGFSLRGNGSAIPYGDDISVIGSNIYIKGRQFDPKQTPCILVYEASRESFIEIPYTANQVSAANITSVPEWNAQVVPLLESMSSQSAAGRVARP